MSGGICGSSDRGRRGEGSSLSPACAPGWATACGHGWARAHGGARPRGWDPALARLRAPALALALLSGCSPADGRAVAVLPAAMEPVGFAPPERPAVPVCLRGGAGLHPPPEAAGFGRDGAVALLYRSPDRVEVERPGWTVAHFDLSGWPDPPRDPAFALPLEDGLLVADRGGQSLYQLRSDGGVERRPLGFAPHALVEFGGGIAVVAPEGHQGALLHALDPSGTRPLPLLLPRVPDPAVGLLAALLHPVPQEGGGALLVPPVLIPIGFALSADGAVVRHSLPIPVGQLERLGRIPPPPYDARAMDALLVNALSVLPHPEGAGLLLLTLSGHAPEGSPERLLVDLDAGFRVRGSAVVPGRPHLLLPSALDGHVDLVEGSGTRWICPRPGIRP